MRARGVDRSELSHIAVIGNALPRQCGLATYTSHSVAALRARYPDLRIDHYAMDDGHGAAYESDVHATIEDRDPSAYVTAGVAIEQSDAQAIWVQHEFGIFGGSAGDYLMTLLRHTEKPLIVTLHTVLANPDEAQDRVMRELVDRAAMLIVMAEHGAAVLRDRYKVPDARISIIPHGAPDRALVPTAAMKSKLVFGRGPLILTFGLISPGKGLEYAIAALPEIVKAIPDLTYAIVGASHPALVRQQGESYREELKGRAEALGVGDHVRFINEFLDDESLLDHLQACDVYLTPYLNEAQITSGTLSYALAVGRPVIATPYIHAREALGGGIGEIVPFRDAEAIGKAMVVMLGDPEALDRRSRLVWESARRTIWSCNAQSVMETMVRGVRAAPVVLRTRRQRVTPSVDLSGTIDMSDNVGIIQHSLFGIPDRAHGYCIDDNARALMLMCQARTADPRLQLRWAMTYASFVQHAWNPESRRFRNFMGYDRQWLETEGSEDSNGRTLWTLGTVVRDAPNSALRRWASDLFNQALPMIDDMGSPRALAFAMLGLAALLDHEPGHVEARRILGEQGAFIAHLLDENRKPDWPWFEAVLSYDNARLPQALIEAGRVLGSRPFLRRGIETLDWIIAQQTAPRGYFRPVGTESFGLPYAPPAAFDQQPLEAAATLDACASAYEATGAERWLDHGRRALAWFEGENDLNLPLSVADNGTCYDGLTAFGVNLNQGAESTLALQMARVRAQALRIDMGRTESEPVAPRGRAA